MKNEKNNLEYRMMGLVPYNISPIQQGIQYGHALQEFNNAIINYILSENFSFDDKNWLKFDKWRKESKTFIILNGGTTNTKGDPRLGHGGTLNQHLFKLADAGVEVATFYEPDLGDQLTAVVFLVDERVWNRDKYPDRVEMDTHSWDVVTNTLKFQYAESEEDFEKRVGGPTNVWLREFLHPRNFKLA
jgi:hypothetical protein